MINAAQKIASIAEMLPPQAQIALLDMAEALARPGRFYDTMTPEQRADLALSIAEAERGEVCDEAELDHELDALLAKHA